MTVADTNLTPYLFGDTYFKMELAISKNGDGPEFSKVTKCLRCKDSITIGRCYNSPIMDTRMYELQYKDGHKASMAANAISENIFYQVDGEGNRHVIFQEIIEHRYDGTEVKE